MPTAEVWMHVPFPSAVSLDGPETLTCSSALIRSRKAVSRSPQAYTNQIVRLVEDPELLPLKSQLP